MIPNILNYYEQLVLDHIHRILLEDDETLQQDQIDDLACLALNRLPARYIRHGIDLAHHLQDAELAKMNQAVNAAVKAGLDTINRRRRERDD